MTRPRRGGGRRARRAGRRAERIAERFLRRRGLRTLARNYAKPWGEIDLVMRDGAVLVFVEVRLRGPGAWEDGATSVDAAKQRRLARAADAWLMEHPRYASDVSRFDVVSMSGTHFFLEQGVDCGCILCGSNGSRVTVARR